MSSIKSCILFLKAGSSLLSTVPQNIVALAKNRIVTQYQQRYPEIKLQFDEGDCDSKGYYEFTDDSLSLRAESLVWPAEKTYSLTDLIDGRQLEFPIPLLDLEKLVPEPVATLTSPGTSNSRWIAPTVVTMGIGLLAGVLIYKAHHHSSPEVATTQASSDQPTRVR